MVLVPGGWLSALRDSDAVAQLEELSGLVKEGNISERNFARLIAISLGQTD